MVEGMEHDSAMKKPGEPDMHACSCCFFLGFGFSHALFLFLLFFRSLVEATLAIEHTRGMALFEVPFICYFEFRMYSAFHGASWQRRSIYFFSHLFALSNLLFFIF